MPSVEAIRLTATPPPQHYTGDETLQSSNPNVSSTPSPTNGRETHVSTLPSHGVCQTDAWVSRHAILTRRALVYRSTIRKRGNDCDRGECRASVSNTGSRRPHEQTFGGARRDNVEVDDGFGVDTSESSCEVLSQGISSI